MKKKDCKNCVWRVDKVCAATDKRLETRYVRVGDCLDKVLRVHCNEEDMPIYTHDRGR